MISICIPVFNHDVCGLARTLTAQAGELETAVELVCIDDCSSEEYRRRNREVATMGRYVQLEENVGRSRIRNLFLEYTEGDYLLFLDNDMVVDEGFLKAYEETLCEGPSVVVGGVRYDPRQCDAAHRLRYGYGCRVESRGAARRSRDPYRSFMTGNFMIRRDVLETIGFDTRIRGYGHEDTLFGYRLKQYAIPIMHIDNAAVNSGVETNEEYLAKTEEAVGNLAEIYGFLRDNHEFCSSVRLLATYGCLRRWGLADFARRCFVYTKDGLRRRLLDGRRVSLGAFNLYKLGVLMERIKN